MEELKYTLTVQEVNFLLDVLDRAQISSFKTANFMIGIAKKLENPEKPAETETAKK